ncbi:hypothetical protein [Haloplasma contractile]|uniref:Bacteriocin transport accessory protein n=1 Tax=Haloplasma contractile SSD-17B TaxID=1033810 RepID=U2FLF9_9MOLU|nr:hypothetical protein [Haloplasma contractile]ERJ13580.1 bacteriocin transport accessory protein [Haloplasma contractile SSD-17B]
MLKMNKLIYSLILIGVILLSGCEQTQEEQNEPEKDFTYLNELTHEEFKAKFDAGEEFFIYIGRPDCGDSRKFEQEFEDLFVKLHEDGSVNFIRYELDQKLYYFDISSIIPDFDKVLRKEYHEKYDFYFTPTLLHYKNVDEDPESDAIIIAEWDPVYGFEPTQYMNWFYDTGLIEPNQDIIHDGGTDRVYDESEEK